MGQGWIFLNGEAGKSEGRAPAVVRFLPVAAFDWGAAPDDIIGFCHGKFLFHRCNVYGKFISPSALSLLPFAFRRLPGFICKNA